MLFDKFDNKTIINGVITAVDPLYIGSAGAETLDPTQVDGSVLKDSNGLPVIPGSSIKGVVRSDFEAIMQMCIRDRYDTRQKWGEWKKDPQVETIKGSSFLISVEKDRLDNAILLLEKMLVNGIGSDTENGYGRIDVCNEIHMLGVNADANR